MSDIDSAIERIKEAVWKAVAPHVDTMRLRAAADAIDRVALPVVRAELEARQRELEMHRTWATQSHQQEPAR